MKEYSITTPSKINIGLNIISKRDDGFHNLETIFYPIKLHDTLLLQEADNFKFVSDNKQLNNDKTNTISKAKELLENLTGLKLSVRVTLSKDIPIGSGMGGGSSDGAAALKAFNEFFSLGLTNATLEKVALKVGADVPFFIDPKPRFASATGEIFNDIQVDLSDLTLLIVNPGIHISTAWAFSKIKPCVPSFSIGNIRELNKNTLLKYKAYIKNDFEEIVFNNYPEISSIKESMYNYGALFSLMTGTGSTVFAFFDSNEDAIKAEMSLSGRYFTYMENYLS